VGGESSLNSDSLNSKIIVKNAPVMVEIMGVSTFEVLDMHENFEIEGKKGSRYLINGPFKIYTE
jgi:hypothetical protein